MAYPDDLKRRLNAAIDHVVAHKEKHVRNPGVGFTRNRKLPIRDTMTLLFSMSGSSLKKELYTGGVDATASTLVQSRATSRPKPLKLFFTVLTSTAATTRPIMDFICMQWTALHQSQPQPGRAQLRAK